MIINIFSMKSIINKYLMKAKIKDKYIKSEGRTHFIWYFRTKSIKVLQK